VPQEIVPASPWGTRLRWYRENVRQETREEFAEALNRLAYSMGENVACGARLIAGWEAGEIQWPRAVYRRLLEAMEAPLPEPEVLGGRFNYIL